LALKSTLIPESDASINLWRKISAALKTKPKLRGEDETTFVVEGVLVSTYEFGHCSPFRLLSISFHHTPLCTILLHNNPFSPKMTLFLSEECKMPATRAGILLDK
jgi:hypothetical protein